MKLEIENLGRIQHAEIDWRPLTVFVGPNGTNKTWAAYAAWTLANDLCPMRANEQATLGVWAKAVLEDVKSRINVAVQARESEPTRIPIPLDDLFVAHGPDVPSIEINGSVLSEALKVDSSLIGAARIEWSVPQSELVKRGSNRIEIEIQISDDDDPSPVRFLIDGRESRTLGTFYARRPLWEELDSAILSVLLYYFDDNIVLPAERIALTTMYNLMTPESFQLIATSGVLVHESTPLRAATC